MIHMDSGSKIDVVCARVGGANTTPFSFLNFLAAYFAKRNLNGGGFQSEGAAEGGCGGNSAAPERPASGASRLVRVLRKMGSNFFKQTPPFQICRRSCLGASPLGSGFRQEIPGGFEFRQKHSRRNSAVPKRSLDCTKGARADERFCKIVGVSATLLSI